MSSMVIALAVLACGFAAGVLVGREMVIRSWRAAMEASRAHPGEEL